MNALKVMLAKKNREVNPESWEQLYESLIIRKIRKRYTVDQELSLHRQMHKKPDEFAEYDAYVERCKAEVKEELGIN
jgi:hypothetical protein